MQLARNGSAELIRGRRRTYRWGQERKRPALTMPLVSCSFMGLLLDLGARSGLSPESLGRYFLVYAQSKEKVREFQEAGTATRGQVSFATQRRVPRRLPQQTAR